jgi:hypothetical protein
MRRFFLVLISTTFFINVFSQSETFDIATFTRPAGWQRADSNGIVIIYDHKTANGQTSFCQVFLFPSKAAANNLAANFKAEWNSKVAKPTGNTTKPITATKINANGWTTVTGKSNITQNGLSYTCILVTNTGFNKVMSVMINIAGENYLPAVRQFLDQLELKANGSSFNPPASQVIVTGTPSLQNYIYTPPPGWTIATYADGIVLSSPLSNNGEKCNITLWPMAVAGNDLQNDAANIFRRVFKGYEGRNSSTPPSLIKGIAAQGWEYFIIKQAIGMPGGDYQTMFGFVCAVRMNNQLAAISGISKDPLVSSCFGLQLANVWPDFFYSLQFKNWNPAAPGQALLKKLPAVWMAITGSAGDRFSFAANGRYAGASAAQRYYLLSSRELLTVTDAYFGEGAYTVQGNKIIFTKDNGGNTPETAMIRIEQESKDGGRTWPEKLYLLRRSVVDGSMYEVCYEKQNN